MENIQDEMKQMARNVSDSFAPTPLIEKYEARTSIHQSLIQKRKTILIKNTPKTLFRNSIMQPQSFQPKEGNTNASYRSRNLRCLTTNIDRKYLTSMQPITDYDNEKEEEDYLESSANFAKIDNSKFRFNSYHNVANNFFQKNENTVFPLQSPLSNENAKNEKNASENSSKKELISPTFPTPRNGLSLIPNENEEINNDNTVHIDNLLIPEDDIDKKPGLRYKINFSNAVGNDLASFFKLTAWNSLEKFLILLPTSHPFLGLKEDLQDRENAWRDFLFKSAKEYYNEGIKI